MEGARITINHDVSQGWVVNFEEKLPTPIDGCESWKVIYSFNKNKDLDEAIAILKAIETTLLVLSVTCIEKGGIINDNK